MYRPHLGQRIKKKGGVLKSTMPHKEPCSPCGGEPGQLEVGNAVCQNIGRAGTEAAWCKEEKGRKAHKESLNLMQRHL